MKTSPFILPDGNVQIAFSGGRTSAYMLHRILEANGGIPEDRVQVTFQNTGREMPETLDFVAEVGRRWQVPIVWTEYRGSKPYFEVVGYQGASRNGEPFDQLIQKKQILPNQGMRFCTVEMKIRTAKRYLRSIGWNAWTSAVGLRADESRRVNKPQRPDLWVNWYPLFAAGVTKEIVCDFWRKQDFDLMLPIINGNSWLGNCDGCFLKSEANIAAFIREYPERAKWWEEKEEAAKHRGDAGRFSFRYSRAELRNFMDRQGDWALSTEGVLCQKDDGECVV